MQELKRINNAMTAFVTHYKTQSGGKITAATLQAYILGLKRAFYLTWGFKLELLGGPVIKNPKAGLLTVVDNKIREQQASGVTRKSLSVLSEELFYALYESKSLLTTTGQGFVTCMILKREFVKGLRPTMLLTFT